MPIQYIFEAGTVGSNQVNKTMEILYDHGPSRIQNRIGGWSFQPKSLMPLQAADLIAYEFFKLITNGVVNGGKRPTRFSIRDLVRPPHTGEYLKYFEKEAFENMATMTPIEPV